MVEARNVRFGYKYRDHSLEWQWPGCVLIDFPEKLQNMFCVSSFIAREPFYHRVTLQQHEKAASLF